MKEIIEEVIDEMNFISSYNKNPKNFKLEVRQFPYVDGYTQFDILIFSKVGLIIKESYWIKEENKESEEEGIWKSFASTLFKYGIGHCHFTTVESLSQRSS